MLLVVNLANTKIKQKSWKMTETLVYESTQRELSNEYQHDRVQTIIKKICILGLWVKVALALEGLSAYIQALDKATAVDSNLDLSYDPLDALYRASPQKMQSSTLTIIS